MVIVELPYRSGKQDKQKKTHQVTDNVYLYFTHDELT